MGDSELGSNDVSKTDWVGRAFRITRVQGVTLVALGLALSWVSTYLLGGAGRVPPHWFYIPILLAAARFGLVGTVLCALAAGALAGPLMPLDVARDTNQPFSDWMGRTGFFVANGFVMALVIGRLKAALGRELELAIAERELTRHKEAVIQIVSHEFRTPLTTIVGTVEFFGEPGVVAESALPLVDGLKAAAQRLENLITVVLAAGGSLIDPGGIYKERVALRALCERAVAAAATTADARVRFELSEEVGSIVCDPEILVFPLQAVLDNALKFSPPSHPVIVSARRTPDAVEIRVKDSGPGMSEDERVTAFEPFTQRDESLTRQSQGLGLGLYAARKTIELLGGTLELRPGTPSGTEAILTIPA